MMKHASVLGLLSIFLSTSAYADALDDADARARAYRAGQPVQKVDGYMPVVPGAIVASEPYEQEIIGDGVDLVTGAPRALCLLTTQMGTLSEAINAPRSDLSVVQSDYDLQTFFSSVTDVTASVNTGSFAASAHTSIGISRSLNLSVHDLAVVAYYTYTLGRRWYNGGYVLDPAYDELRRTDPLTFIGRCGHGFLQSAENGVGMMVVFRLHQRHEVRASSDDIKATLSARYGLAKADVTETLTDRQREILNSYDLTSQCYVMGGRVDTCGLIRSADDVYKVWGNLTSSFSNNDAVALRTGYMPYSDAFSDPRLDITPERIRLLKLWEDKKSWVHNICAAAPYITECGPELANMDAQELLIDDPHSTALREPGIADGLAVFLQGEIGRATMFESVNGTGRQYAMHFSLNPKVTDALKPDVLYSMKDFAFEGIMSSAMASLEYPGHWVLEFYSNEDGTGTVWSPGNTNTPINVPLGHSCGLFGWSWCDSFNDQAKSFRLRYLP